MVTSIILHSLVQGLLLASVPWFVSRLAGRRTGITVAWIEIALVVAVVGWWVAPILGPCPVHPNPNACPLWYAALALSLLKLPFLLLPFLLLIGQLGGKGEPA